jgi:L-alanine-DL-glutamate epimerase-like enolase superfamily enzyme
LAALPLFEAEPGFPVYQAYRRWAYESAALDLALRQAGASLADVVGRDVRPLTFVVSGNLGDPPTSTRLRRLLDLYPGMRFKLDVRPDWTDAIYAELVELGCVDSIDFKGFYTGTAVDNPPDAEMYRRVAETFPDAWLEDPALTPETNAVLAAHRDRVTWDAPIHGIEDIEALAWPPRTVNIKPSRFGSIERLLSAYDYCEAQGIAGYGGGQFELGVGRGHIQLLAALFHPDTPNDVAPGGFNLPDPPGGLPASPLAVTAAPTGFRAV